MLSSLHLYEQDRLGIGTFQTKDEKKREEPFHAPRCIQAAPANRVPVEFVEPSKQLPSFPSVFTPFHAGHARGFTVSASISS